MRASVSLNHLSEIKRAFEKFFNLFILPTHELYLKQSGPFDQVIRFRINSCNTKTFESFYTILTDSNVW